MSLYEFWCMIQFFMPLIVAFGLAFLIPVLAAVITEGVRSALYLLYFRN